MNACILLVLRLKGCLNYRQLAFCWVQFICKKRGKKTKTPRVGGGIIVKLLF